MKTIFFGIFLFSALFLSAQVFQVDTLQYKGNSNKYINIVILGDGYTATQQTNFIADANTLSAYILSQVPWVNYSGYFNVFAIRVISAQPGAKHPNTAGDCSSASPTVPVSNPNTYFGCSFDVGGIHRLLVPQNTSAISNVLAANFPNYDQVLMLSNTPYYGGSGGSYATSSLHTSSKEIIAHEIGHSFAGLADEYYAGDSYATEKPNMTQQTNPTLVKWKNWVGINSVGIYQHCCGGNSAVWYKPHNNCKMQYLNSPYCSVCSQQIVESIHTLVNPIVSYVPLSSVINSTNTLLDFKMDELMKPNPNSLIIKWTLNNALLTSNVDSVQVDQNILSGGSNTLTASVTDSSSLIRADNHSTLHIHSVTWTINKTTAGIKTFSAENKISCTIYPNPSTELLNITLELEKRSSVRIQLISAEGKIIEQIVNKEIDKGTNLNTININDLSVGNYFVAFTINGVTYSQPFIKTN